MFKVGGKYLISGLGFFLKNGSIATCVKIEDGRGYMKNDDGCVGGSPYHWDADIFTEIYNNPISLAKIIISKIGIMLQHVRR